MPLNGRSSSSSCIKVQSLETVLFSHSVSDISKLALHCSS